MADSRDWHGSVLLGGQERLQADSYRYHMSEALVNPSGVPEFGFRQRCAEQPCPTCSIALIRVGRRLFADFENPASCRMSSANADAGPRVDDADAQTLVSGADNPMRASNTILDLLTKQRTEGQDGIR